MQMHSDSQKRRLVCVSRYAPFYTNQTPLLPRTTRTSTRQLGHRQLGHPQKI